MKKIILIVALGISSLNIYAELEPEQEAFFKAVNNNDPQAVKAAIENGADINMIDSKTGTTALYKTLLQIDKYIAGRWMWLLPTISSAITGALSVVTALGGGVAQAQLIEMDIPKANEAFLPLDTKAELDFIRSVRTAGFIIGIGSAIGSGLLGRLAHVLRTRLVRAQRIAQMLVTNPKIKIDDMSDKLRRQIMSKLPQQSQTYLRVRKPKVATKPKVEVIENME